LLWFSGEKIININFVTGVEACMRGVKSATRRRSATDRRQKSAAGPCACGGGVAGDTFIVLAPATAPASLCQ